MVTYSLIEQQEGLQLMLLLTASARLVSDIPEQTLQMLSEIVEPLRHLNNYKCISEFPENALHLVQFRDQQWQLRGRECHRVSAVAQVFSVA